MTVNSVERYLVISVALVAVRACFRVRRRSTTTSTDGPAGSSVNPWRQGRTDLPAVPDRLLGRPGGQGDMDITPDYGEAGWVLVTMFIVGCKPPIKSLRLLVACSLIPVCGQATSSRRLL